MKHLRPLLLFVGASIAFSPLAEAGLLINATFDTTITTNPSASLIQAGINEAISRIESEIANTVTVNIDFTAVNTGLGQSSTFATSISYSSYINYLLNGQTLSANDLSAVASLPVGSSNPVTGDTDVYVNTALYKTMGHSYAGSDGTISLNLSLMNLSRTGPQDGSLYDLEAVVAHEIDEVLGIGGTGSILPDTSGPVRPLDLFRYSAPGVRSLTADTNATAYFSIDGGVTQLAKFNQDSSGDYADWATGGTPEVQDAFLAPGITANVGINELKALDVIGYQLAMVPEPSALAFLGLGTMMLLGAARRRKRSQEEH